MTFGSDDAAVDEIVESCGGDLRGAVKVLLLVNERLEAELAQLHAAAADPSSAKRSGIIQH